MLHSRYLGSWLTVAIVLVCLKCGSRTAAAADGAELFHQNCAPCHGPDGRARTPAARKLGVKDLTVSRVSDADIEKQINDGRKDNKGKDKMPAFRGKLTPEQIEALIPIVKSFRK